MCENLSNHRDKSCQGWHVWLKWRISCKQNHWYLAHLLIQLQSKHTNPSYQYPTPKQKERVNDVWLNWSTADKNTTEVKKGFDVTQNNWLIETKMACFFCDFILLTTKTLKTNIWKVRQSILLEVTQTFVSNHHFSHSVALTNYSGVICRAEIPRTGNLKKKKKKVLEYDSPVTKPGVIPSQSGFILKAMLDCNISTLEFLNCVQTKVCRVNLHRLVQICFLTHLCFLLLV